MRKWIVAIAVGLWLWCPQVRAQVRPINLGKSLVRVASPGALLMPGMAMPTTFPNSYDSSVNSVSYDPNAGSQGTIYLNYTFTGTTNQPSPMCSNGARHIPQVRVAVYNNGVYKSDHYGSGYGVGPCVQMNQTVTLSFDIGSDQCQLDLFANGTCVLTEEQDQVYCTVAAGFAWFIKKWQFEGATTETQTAVSIPPYYQVPWCGDASDPPDWYIQSGVGGDPTGYNVATAELIRWQRIGSSFRGVLWKQLTQIGVVTPVPAGPKPICTMYDNGCRWGAAFCSGPPPGSRNNQDDPIKRLDALYLCGSKRTSCLDSVVGQ